LQPTKTNFATPTTTQPHHCTAEALILGAEGGNKEYLPIEGLPAFRAATVKLLLGEGHPAVAEGRVATLQALSGTGSLRVGAAFIARFLPKGTAVYLSDPTWGNHRNIFGDEGVEWRSYRYFDAESVGLDWRGMAADLEAAPEGSVVLLHGERGREREVGGGVEGGEFLKREGERERSARCARQKHAAKKTRRQ